jgi:hypothetical protein
VHLPERVKFIDIMSDTRDATYLDITGNLDPEFIRVSSVCANDQPIQQSRNGKAFQEWPMQRPDCAPGSAKIKMIIDAEHGFG